MRGAGTGPESFETICGLLHTPAKQRVVLGTGCFDLIHIGHLYFLEQASSQGDVLVIGVNSDRSVREIKGPSRPVVGELERARLVAALRWVDHVFVYDETVADSQIRALRPDVYVTGAESVTGYPSELVAAGEAGVRVHVIDRLAAYSTTSTLDDVDRRHLAHRHGCAPDPRQPGSLPATTPAMEQPQH